MVTNARDIIETEDAPPLETRVYEPRSSAPSAMLPVRPLMLANPANLKDFTVKISDLGVGDSIS